MKRPWFELITNPQSENIHLEEIAHSLSMLCRFNGHVKHFYSVAQHSVHVSRLVGRPYAMFGLMHDASEAYLGDVVSPLKDVIRSVYAPIEARLMQCIAEKFRFRMDEVPKHLVKLADLTMLVTEARDISSTVLDRQPDAIPLESLILDEEHCLSPERAEEAFLTEFQNIRNFD